MTSWFSMTTATVGGIASTYNGNLTAAGNDTYAYDYRNMMTSATIDSTTTDYTYDGDGLRSTKEATEYVYDRESGLPMLVDDGANAYLHEDGALAAIDGSDDALYLLGDALGSVRGVTDEAGDLVGSSNYDVYGEVRASSGVSTLFRYTGEQLDTETGFTYLRARYLNSPLGRFTNADTVQPNAPGTQGYNLFAYVANNPTTWTDPSGNVVEAPNEIDTMFESIRILLAQARAAYVYDVACRQTGSGCAGIAAAGWSLINARTIQSVLIGFALAAAAAPLICVFESSVEMAADGQIGWTGCLGKVLKYTKVIDDYAPPATAPAPEAESAPTTNEDPQPFAPRDPALPPAPPNPGGQICDVDQLGVEIPPDRMQHILEEHGPSATSFVGGSPKGRFAYGESNIRSLVRHAIVLGHGKWTRSGTRCVLNQSLPFGNIGKDNAGVPTSCVRVVTATLTRPYYVHTAYPYPQAGCL